MKVAIDVHGTIDSHPEFFSDITKKLRKYGFEIHITTGISISEKLRKNLMGWGIEYDRLFSITDYHKSIGTSILWDEKGNPHIPDEIWDSTKADYCEREEIDVAIDDSLIYGKYFTKSTKYILYPPEEE